MQLYSGLEELKLEGNQLIAMPTGLLQLRRLRHLKVTNNFMHPLFWKDAVARDPQVSLPVFPLPLMTTGSQMAFPEILTPIQSNMSIHHYEFVRLCKASSLQKD